MEALNFNDDTYYVGFDANQGAELQGTMIKDYIEANIDTIDRNGDGQKSDIPRRAFSVIRTCVYMDTYV